MDRLAGNGFVLLGGPIGGGQRALHLAEATDGHEIRTHLGGDPWASMELLQIEVYGCGCKVKGSARRSGWRGWIARPPPLHGCGAGVWAGPAGGEGRLSNELMSRVAERSVRTAPAGHEQSWAMLAAHYEGIKGLLGQGLTVVKAGELLAAVAWWFPSGRCTVTRWRS